MRSYTTVFILAPHRSGSTLPDNLLASHPAVVTLGEIDKLRAYALEDRRLYDPGLFRSGWVQALLGGDAIVDDSWRRYDAVYVSVSRRRGNHTCPRRPI